MAPAGQGPDGARAYLSSLTATSQVPGLQYVALDAKGVVFAYEGGWADIQRRVSMAPDVTLMAYSMSKTITAVAVLQLAGSGRLGLDDRLAKYVNDSPYGPDITVRHLIAHASGIPNPIPLRWVHPSDEHETFDETAALGTVMHANRRTSSAPGTRYRYSNIGYWLLGRIVERASGQLFPSYVQEHIVRPLGIAPRELAYTVMDPARHATGYLEKYSLMTLAKGFLIDRALVGDYAGSWLELRRHYPNGPAFGGLVGTARAFGVFLQDQLRPQSVLLRDETRRLMYQPEHTTSGTALPMTLGWHIGKRDATTFFYKEGGGGGFHCLMRVYPAAGRATVLMTNATGFNVTSAMDTVDAMLIAFAP